MCEMHGGWFGRGGTVFSEHRTYCGETLVDVVGLLTAC